MALVKRVRERVADVILSSNRFTWIGASAAQQLVHGTSNDYGMCEARIGNK